MPPWKSNGAPLKVWALIKGLECSLFEIIINNFSFFFFFNKIFQKKFPQQNVLHFVGLVMNKLTLKYIYIFCIFCL